MSSEISNGMQIQLACKILDFRYHHVMEHTDFSGKN